MTVQKDEIDLQRALFVKAIRSKVRLKHALEADRELNTLLPAAEKEFDRRIKQGELLDDTDLELLARELSR